MRVTIGTRVSNQSKDNRESKPEGCDSCTSRHVQDTDPAHLTDREASDSDQYANHAGRKPRLWRIERSMRIGKETIEPVSKERQHTTANRDVLPYGLPHRPALRVRHDRFRNMAFRIHRSMIANQCSEKRAVWSPRSQGHHYSTEGAPGLDSETGEMRIHYHSATEPST